MVYERALQFYAYVTTNYKINFAENFDASNSWFKCFKDRFLSHHVSFSGEKLSSDEVSAKVFITVFKNLIAVKDYLLLI